ncbi:hypothetical protein CEH05_18825 [Halobacillus halophilus]|uniref:PTS system subunit IIA, trehalose-specific n=1 Tax=Halobacillus halophilus (strain ATCC 35676 / DSM 2266 / JCM 20832 / KCTC 3685 / LMG 17431 / NBRC 102448 / NCIMB 2269) TaxID=866895 RepID=I0JSQ3_HALH3|nr:PTS glucose transporter subunit IIA [Halobacillus halophilus]ASF41103.1 hypothetical protein CEH05_18825 [Halobacillus halophilus]CCG47175.1 PTS system subunit IIA, trehalose-specific [Halobacillus halophilus DSM 2266]
MKLFGNKKEEVNLAASKSGKVVALREVPTPVLSQKMRREGIAIESADGMFLNPVKGEVVQIFHTMYSVGIKAQKEADTLIQIGLENVSMEGRR